MAASNPTPGGSSPARSRRPKAATPGSCRHLRPTPAHGWRRRTSRASPPSSGTPATRARRAPSDLSEELQAGYDFVDTVCNVTRITRKRQSRPPQWFDADHARRRGDARPQPVRELHRAKPHQAGTIEIEKNATPESSQVFAFTGSLGIGDFTLVDDRTDEYVSRIFANLPPGTYTVSEMVPEDWELTGITCTPATAAVIAGTQVTITLAPGGSVVCTYIDTRIDPPVPPEPPEPRPCRRLRPTTGPAGAAGAAAGHPAPRGQDDASRCARRRPDSIQADGDEHRLGRGEGREAGRRTAGVRRPGRA